MIDASLVVFRLWETTSGTNWSIYICKLCDEKNVGVWLLPKNQMAFWRTTKPRLHLLNKTYQFTLTFGGFNFMTRNEISRGPQNLSWNVQGVVLDFQPENFLNHFNEIFLKSIDVHPAIVLIARMFDGENEADAGIKHFIHRTSTCRQESMQRLPSSLYSSHTNIGTHARGNLCPPRPTLSDSCYLINESTGYVTCQLTSDLILEIFPVKNIFVGWFT